MRKSFILFFTLCMTLSVAACSRGNNDVQNGGDTASVVSGEDKPLYAENIENGTYEITVDASSSMFRVINCELIVEDNEMNAVMTMSGQGYGMVYMGTSEEAMADSEDKYIPFVLNENGEKTFTVPVEELDKEIDCAAWSIRKEKWYDRKLIFNSKSITESTKTIADGTYSVEVTLSGGSGKTKIEDANVTIENGEARARIVWSSPHYEYMIIDNIKYEPVQKSGNSTFEIPIVFNTEMTVSASTVAMSQPHLIEYGLYFDSNTLIGE